MAGAVRPRSADILVDEIIRKISRGEYLDGARIGSEQDLIDHFGLSRAVVREGLRILEREGLVTVKPGPTGGIFSRVPDVRPLSRLLDVYGSIHDVTMDDLIEARMELEVLTARLAAERATEDDIKRLEQHDADWKRLVAEGDTEGAARANVGFHVSLAASAHNPVFVVFMDALEGLVYETALEPQYPVRLLDYVVYSHQYVLDAVRRRDVREAADLMRKHLQIFRPNAWDKSRRAGAVLAVRPVDVGNDMEPETS